MKIQSKLQFNTSLLARHQVSAKDTGKVVIGGLNPEYLNIPAGATIELGDEEWKKFAQAAKGMLSNGDLVMTVAPKKSVAEAKADRAAAVAAAKAVLAEEEAAVKAEKKSK
tara:strand:+ start:9921 stop:10253 length:333 start_codon:yes stop_codon:yes gene_type:complete